MKKPIIKAGAEEVEEDKEQKKPKKNKKQLQFRWNEGEEVEGEAQWNNQSKGDIGRETTRPLLPPPISINCLYVQPPILFYYTRTYGV